MGGKEKACLDPDFLKPILARRAPRSAGLLCRVSAIEGSACNKSEPQVAASHQNSGVESLHGKKANEAAGGRGGVFQLDSSLVPPEGECPTKCLALTPKNGLERMCSRSRGKCILWTTQGPGFWLSVIAGGSVSSRPRATQSPSGCSGS